MQRDGLAYVNSNIQAVWLNVKIFWDKFSEYF